MTVFYEGAASGTLRGRNRSLRMIADTGPASGQQHAVLQIDLRAEIQVEAPTEVIERPPCRTGVPWRPEASGPLPEPTPLLLDVLVGRDHLLDGLRRQGVDPCHQHGKDHGLFALLVHDRALQNVLQLIQQAVGPGIVMAMDALGPLREGDSLLQAAFLI